MRYLLAIIIVLSICSFSNSSWTDYVRESQPVKVEKDGTEPKVIQFKIVQFSDNEVMWATLYDDGELWRWSSRDRKWNKIELPR